MKYKNGFLFFSSKNTLTYLNPIVTKFWDECIVYVKQDTNNINKLL